jgi:hypothetical protein
MYRNYICLLLLFFQWSLVPYPHCITQTQVTILKCYCMLTLQKLNSLCPAHTFKYFLWGIFICPLTLFLVITSSSLCQTSSQTGNYFNNCIASRSLLICWTRSFNRLKVTWRKFSVVLREGSSKNMERRTFLRNFIYMFSQWNYSIF